MPGYPRKGEVHYWKETDGRYLGYLDAYPDHWTQGDDLEDLRKHLKDLFETFGAEDIPGIKKEEELEVALSDFLGAVGRGCLPILLEGFYPCSERKCH